MMFPAIDCARSLVLRLFVKKCYPAEILHLRPKTYRTCIPKTCRTCLRPKTYRMATKQTCATKVRADTYRVQSKFSHATRRAASRCDTKCEEDLRKLLSSRLTEGWFDMFTMHYEMR